MNKIAILGGNGQVGAEVSIYLSQIASAPVVCVLRSEYGAALLRLLGVEFRIVDYDDPQALRAALADCSVVADFRYPSGELTDIFRCSKRGIAGAIGALRPTSTYVFMSSIMAFGMPEGASRVRNYVFPRTSYSYIKRGSERYALKEGVRNGVRVVIYRLGQIHGVLQSASAEYAAALSTGRVRVAGRPDDLAVTAFASSVADALVNVAARCKSGVYTLLSSPQWTLFDLFAYYQSAYGIDAEIIYESGDTTTAFTASALTSGFLSSFRGMVETYVLLRLPWLFPHFKGRYRVSRMLCDANVAGSHTDVRISPVTGRPPGKVVESEPCPPATLSRVTRRLSELIDAGITNGAINRTLVSHRSNV